MANGVEVTFDQREINCVFVTVSISKGEHQDQKASLRGKYLFGLHFQISDNHWEKSG